MSYREIIKIDPAKRFGKPIVRNTRITLYDVLGWLASDMSFQEKISDFPELTEADIKAYLAYVADQNQEKISLHPEQTEMLMMSEVDIKNGNVVSESELDRMDLEWLY